ncbi:MAG: hypothetical protein ABRQ25_03140 [Clostridiaceae bacterium]
MKIFIGRQPIFDKNNNVISYELLFRGSMENKFNAYDGDTATLKVLESAFHTMGIDAVTEGKKAFINFTEGILKKDILSSNYSENLVVEILETVEPTEEIVGVCKRLKSQGFTIALDDFVYNDKYRPLLKYTDIIKVDFKMTKGIERKKLWKISRILT